ncbi:hypothetical protein OROGR_032775 [Orobanche gracilis]
MKGFHLLFVFNLLILFIGESINVAKSKIDSAYIVYMGALSSQNGASDQLLGMLLKRETNPVLHIYNNSFSGFAARLSEEEAKSIAALDGVVSVFPDRVSKLHTTHSWDFLKSESAGLKFDSAPMPTSSPPISRPSKSGAYDTIIGIFDTGIWPESASFNDDHMGPIPSRWKGTCQHGRYTNSSFICNRKVIGARFYNDPSDPDYTVTPRDLYGHGTHVASTAAGRPVPGASYYGVANGTAVGGAPDARIAMYKICGDDGDCLESAILKAFDDAIADGVDVISLSSGYPPEKEDDITEVASIGAFHATEKGIIVVCSAGNSGPSPMTVENTAPWVLTVAATTIDRDFEANIALGANKQVIVKTMYGGLTPAQYRKVKKVGDLMTGEPTTEAPVNCDRNYNGPKVAKFLGGGINLYGLKIHPLIYGSSAQSNSNNHEKAYNASNCIPGSLDAHKVKGKNILCESKDGIDGFGDKHYALRKQGAAGMISIDNIYRQFPLSFLTDLVGAVVGEDDGARLLSYVNSTSLTLGYKPAPVVAYISSRGPPYGIPNLLKPDIAAPGVGILAAWLAVPGKEPPLFVIRSGTSMACPHVSGLAAILKSAYPTWTIQKNNLDAPITTLKGLKATPYDIGAGQMNLLGALHPGLVYETDTNDYIQFLCNKGYNASVIKTMSPALSINFSCPRNSRSDLISDMNYPSIVVSGLKVGGTRTVIRTVTNVGEVDSTYDVYVEYPAGIRVRVVPNILQFRKNVKKQSFRVSFELTTSSRKDLFGSITWSSDKHKVRSPFVASNG